MPRRDDFDDRPRRPPPPDGGFGVAFAVGCGVVVVLGGAAAGAVWLFVDAVGPRKRPAPAPAVVGAPAPPPAPVPVPVVEPTVGIPAVVGGVAVTVTDVRVGKVTGIGKIGGDPGVTNKELLRVAVSVENRTDRAVRFTRWTTGATLTTDKNNTLGRVRVMLADKLDGELAGDTTIPAGGRVSDVYVFEPPGLLETGGRLELDAARVGESGTFRFRLHWSSVRRDPRFGR